MNKDAQGRWKVGMSNIKLKMRDPRIPTAVSADPQQQIHILPFSLLKESTHVEPLARQFAPFGNSEREKESPDASVSISQRVDGFKLVVGEEGSYQRIKLIICVEMLLEGV